MVTYHRAVLALIKFGPALREEFITVGIVEGRIKAVFPLSSLKRNSTVTNQSCHGQSILLHLPS